MAGRVHGRVAGGQVFILSDRDLVFERLRPTPPEFQLAGDAERVAITCAAMGVDASDLELPIALDRTAYRRALATLTDRGLVESGRLTRYGHDVEAMPVERAWGELLVHAGQTLVPVVAVCANIDSLHRMTRDVRDLEGVRVAGSDHLTAYNLYAEAVNRYGSLGEVYGLPRHIFDDEALDAWATDRGVLVKAIEDIALGTASVFRALELPLPAKLPYAGRELRDAWIDLVARIMPFDLVLDERTADGQEARVSRNSMAGGWGAVAGSLRFFADRYGVPRASIEGSTIPYELIRRYATRDQATLEVTANRRGLVIRRELRYFGFELESVVEPVDGPLPVGLRAEFPRTLAAALVAGGTTHPAQGRIRRAAEELDELWRRSGGSLPAAAPDAVRTRLAGQLESVGSWAEFLSTPVALDADLVPEAERIRLGRLPGQVRVLGDTIPLRYRVHEGSPVAVLELREGQARRARPADLPVLDRPLRLAVVRGGRAGLEAGTLEELRGLLRESGRTEPRGRTPRGRRRHR
jgi:hypothetical protein